jgi:hypothetical protein
MTKKSSSQDLATVSEALNYYWVDKTSSGHTPDYAGFTGWMVQRVETAKSTVPLPLHSGRRSAPSFQLPFELLAAAKAAGVEITRDGAKPDPNQFGKRSGNESHLKSLNKGKLLLSYFADTSVRWRETLLALSKSDISADSLAQRPSQSEHRAAFFHAVSNGDEHTAFKMVGRLRTESHDIGEVEFLEATASFHSNRFDEAIKFARQVPKDAIDRQRAFMLLLESFAYLGDIKTIEAELLAVPEFIFPDYFLRYVCQIAIENSATPKIAFESTSRIIESTLGLAPLGLGAFQMWNRHSCQLVVQYVEHLRDGALKDDAVRQSAMAEEPDELHTPLRLQQIEYALALDSDLVLKLSEIDDEDASIEIVKRLMNYGDPGREEYFQALTTQWRIGDRSRFLANVLANDELLVDATSEAQQVILWAYQEARIATRHSDAELFKSKLLHFPAMAAEVNKIEAANTPRHFERGLSPMGRLALRSANWDLLNAEKEALLWKDAGMISLGFFRIIELECNERIILPMLPNLDVDLLGEYLNNLKVTSQDNSTKRTAVFWGKMLPQLRRAKQQSKGLELGALELLLAKIADPTGPDSVIKMPIYRAVLQRLTSTGVDALISGELSRLLDADAREKFRNPPAHSRYVDLATARECKRYTEDVLGHLIEFSIEKHEAKPTTH